MVKRIRWFALLLVALFMAAPGVSSAATPLQPATAQQANAAELPDVHGGVVRSSAFIRGADKSLSVTAYSSTRPTAATSLIPGYDDVSLSSIPANSSFTGGIGCYGFGSFTNCPEARNRFPHAKIVTITPSELGTAQIIDTEPGDAVPSQDAPWIRRMISLHVFRPGVYADASEMVQVKADLAGSGLTHCTSTSTSSSCYVLWVAAWDGNPGIPAGYDAHQWFGGMVIDKDTFGSWIFKAAAPPNAPGCSTPSIKTSYCWGRFTTLDWFNRPAGSKTAKVKPSCYYGCVERSLVKRLTGEIFAAQTPARLKGDLGRAKAVCGRLTYLERHRSVKENGDTYTYGRKPNVCGRSKDIARGSWKGYL